MVRDTLRKASKVVDAPLRKTEEAVRKIAERPDIDLMDAPHLVWEFLQKGRQQAEKAKGVIDAQLRKRLKDMGLATREEMDALRRRISELEAAARARPPAREAPAKASEADEEPSSSARPRAKAGTARPKASASRTTRARAKTTGPTKTSDEP